MPRPERMEGESTLQFNARKAHAQRVDLEEMHRQEDLGTVSEPPLVKAVRVWEDVPKCTCGRICCEGRTRRVADCSCPMHKGI